MTEYLIAFNDEWVQEHTQDESEAKGVAAKAVVREMQEQGVLIFTNGGLDRDTAICSVVAEHGAKTNTRYPLASDVDGDVPDPALQAADEFHFRLRRALEVQAAHGVALGVELCVLLHVMRRRARLVRRRLRAAEDALLGRVDLGAQHGRQAAGASARAEGIGPCPAEQYALRAKRHHPDDVEARAGELRLLVEQLPLGDHEELTRERVADEGLGVPPGERGRVAAELGWWQSARVGGASVTCVPVG